MFPCVQTTTCSFLYTQVLDVSKFLRVYTSKFSWNQNVNLFVLDALVCVCMSGRGNPNLIRATGVIFDETNAEVMEKIGKRVAFVSRSCYENFLPDDNCNNLRSFRAHSDVIAYHGSTNSAPNIANFFAASAR